LPSAEFSRLPSEGNVHTRIINFQNHCEILNILIFIEKNYMYVCVCVCVCEREKLGVYVC